MAAVSSDRPVTAWPRMTVVTPSYQQGNFIEETIRSVLLQGYPNLEYFVIDGGSTDETVEIIRKYEPWLAGWVSEKDRGQSHAINKGFARATGNALAWLNSDDIYLPGAMFEAVRGLERTNFTAPVHGHCLRTEGDIRTDEIWPARYLGRQELIRFWQRQHQLPRPDSWFISQPAVFFPKELLERTGGLDENLEIAMDYDLWIRMSAFGDFVAVPGSLARFRVHPTSKSVKVENWMDEALLVSRRYWGGQASPAYWRHRWSFERWRRSPLAEKEFMAAESALCRGARRSAVAHVLDGLATWPPAVLWRNTRSLIARMCLPSGAVAFVRKMKRRAV